MDSATIPANVEAQASTQELIVKLEAETRNDVDAAPASVHEKIRRRLGEHHQATTFAWNDTAV